MERMNAFGDDVSKTVVNENGENARMFDSAFKRFFRRKAILAVILKGIVPEFESMNPRQIESYIYESSINPLNVETLSEEDVDGGSKVVYDIVIKCKLPDSDDLTDVDIIFDLEMQRIYNMPYSLADRAIYYASRHVARQSVKSSSYDKILPVYSTWICMCNNKVLKNTAHKIRLVDDGEVSVLPERSIFNIDILLISREYDWDTSDDGLIKFLQAIFKNKMNDKEFNPYVEVNDAMSRELDELRLEQEQYEYEMQVGRAEAAAEGRAEGRAEGIISTARRLNVTDRAILRNMLIEELHITQEEAEQYLKKYLPN